MPLKHSLGLILAVFLVCAPAEVWTESAAGAAPANLTSIEVVDQIQTHNQARTDELKQYKSLRHYQVEYRGYATTLEAKMDVEVSYNAATGKSFRIVSQSGSSFLCDKVLKRAVDSEKEAAQDKGSTALTTGNYKFAMLGTEKVEGRSAYVLNVEPLTESKFLYKGKIWVDAADFAVVKMETEPAKNPSFWISRTLIHYTSAYCAWLLASKGIRSETKVRIGGTAVLTIDYGSYPFEPGIGMGSAS